MEHGFLSIPAFPFSQHSALDVQAHRRERHYGNPSPGQVLLITQRQIARDKDVEPRSSAVRGDTRTPGTQEWSYSESGEALVRLLRRTSEVLIHQNEFRRDASTLRHRLTANLLGIDLN